MSSHDDNPHNSTGEHIPKALHKQQRKNYRCHEEVEHRDDAPEFSTTYSKRSDHDEENNKTLLNSFRHNEIEEQKKAFKTSTILAKDLHYYAILARIHDAVTSVNNTPSLGSILEDANKRGMSLDAVIELYKEERIKAISLQGSSENLIAAPKVTSTVTGVEGGKEVERHETPSDVNKCKSNILSGIPEMKRCHDTCSPTGSTKEVREDVEQVLLNKGTLHSNLTSVAPSFESFSSPSTFEQSITVRSENGLALRHDDNSENDNNIILKVSSEVEEIENKNWERRPDPPGHLSEYERHPDPPGLSLDDSSDIVSLSGSSMSQEHQDIFDNCVELVLKERSKEALTCRAKSFDLEQNLSCIGRVEDDEIDDKHPDPPGRSYSLTIDSDDMSSAAWPSPSTSHKLDHKAFVNEIDQFQLKEGNKYKPGHSNQSSQSHNEGGISEFDSSEVRDFICDSKVERQKLLKDDEESQKIHNEEICPDTSRISTCSTSDSDNGVEIILADCSIESKGAVPEENYFDDVASHQYFNVSEPHLKQSSLAEESFVVDCEKLRNDVVHNVEHVPEAGEGELPQLESSSSSLHHVEEADDERFSSPTTPPQRNTQKQNQDTYGDGVEIGLESSLDDSIDDDDQTSQCSDEVSSLSLDSVEADNNCFSSPKLPEHNYTQQEKQDTHGDGVEIGLENSLDNSIDDDDQMSQCSDEALSSSLDSVEADDECFSSPTTPQHRNTQKQNQDTYGDGVEFGLENSLDDSIDDDDQTSQCSGEASSSSLEYVEAGNECFSLPKTTEHKNSQQEKQDTYGDGVEFGLEDSHDDSIEDDDKMSQRSDVSLTQGANYGVEICTLGSENEHISGNGLKDTELAEGAKQECNPDDKYTGSYLGSSVTPEHQDNIDNGIEIILDETPYGQIIEQLSCCDDAEINPNCNELTPKENVASIDISALDLDNMKLWKANSNDTEGSENGDQSDQFDILLQASSSMVDSDHECSHSCSISSTSEKFQGGSSYSNSDGIIDETSKLSRDFSHVTEVASEAIGITESDETPAVQLNGSESTNVSFPTHEEQHELIRSDASSSCSDNSKSEHCAGEEQVSMETGAFSEPSICDSVEEGVDIRIDSSSAAVDAFFSRFSIQTDNEHIYVDCKEHFDCKDLEEESGTDDTCENNKGISRRGEKRSKDVRGIRNTKHNHRVSDDVEIAKTMEHLPQSVKEDSYLPNHLGLWKSPWQKTKLPRGRYLYAACCDATKSISSSEYTNRKNYHMGHSGYSNIDFYSLYEASLVKAEEEEIDQAPWECRDVGQRFLHEKSVESRNWFGSFELIRGNDRLQYPVCCPKSVEVSVTRIPEEGDWSEDWFTTWKSRKDNPNNLESFAQDDKENTVNDVRVETAVQSFRETDTMGKSIVVEIGSLCPIRLRPGERITRIHPEYTSSLRHSRWRKKYIKGHHLFSSV